MKKIFSFLCALTIVLSASAAPRFGLTREAKGAKAQVSLTAPVRKAAPKAPAKLNGEVINIEANNLAVDLSYFDLYLQYLGYGFFRIEGGTDEYAVSAELYTADENYYTTYSTADESIELSVNETALTVSSAELRSTEKGDQFVATAVDEEGNTYNINLTLFAPDEPAQTIQLSYSSCEINDYTSYYGFYYITAQNENDGVYLALLSAPEAGTYSKADFSAYTGIELIAGTDTTWISEFFSIDATITETETGKLFKVQLFATDATLYDVEITYTKPVADKTETVVLDNVTFEDYRADDGSWQVIAAPADSSIVFSLNPYSESLAADLTVADLDGTYSWLKIVENEEAKYYTFAEGEFTASVEANGVLKLTGWILASNNVKYEFTFTTAEGAVDLSEGIEHVVLTEKAQKVVVDGAVYVIRDNKLFNVLGAQVR